MKEKVPGQLITSQHRSTKSVNIKTNKLPNNFASETRESANQFQGQHNSVTYI